MSLNNIPVIRSDKFAWNGNDGFAEHSELNKSIFNRIYNDACDAGFAVVSVKTGTILVFAYSNTDFYGDEEEAGWRFTCIGKLISTNLRLQPVETPIEILVIND